MVYDANQYFYINPELQGVCVIFLFLLKRFLSLAKEKKSIVCFKA